MAFEVSRLGEINEVGSAYLALFLKIFAGEVLNSYNDKAVMLPRTRVKSITSGKSAQFPAIGTTTAVYHTVGADILDADASYLDSIKHAERIIGIDEQLTSNIFVAEIDEMMNHYETRSEYAKQMGIALANKADQQIMQVLALAAAHAANITGGDGGGNVNGGATLATDMSLFADACYEAQSILDQKNVPAEDRFVLVTPDIYWRLVRMGGAYGSVGGGPPVELLDKDFSVNNGDVAGGRIVKIGGLTIVPSNIWDTIDGIDVSNSDASERGIEGTTNYDVNLSTTVALVWQKGAVGTVKMRDISLQTQYWLPRLGTLMVAKHLMGHGILRPECAITLKAA